MAHSKGGSLSLPLTNKPPQPKTTLGAPPRGGGMAPFSPAAALLCCPPSQLDPGMPLETRSWQGFSHQMLQQQQQQLVPCIGEAGPFSCIRIDPSQGCCSEEAPQSALSCLSHSGI